MTSAEDSQQPVGAPRRSGAALFSPSAVVWGLMAIATLSIFRAAILGPDADTPGRLLLLIGGIGVPLSLVAVMLAVVAGRLRPAASTVSAAAMGLAAVAVAVALVGVGLQLGSAAGSKFRVPLWQLETDPVVALILGLVALAAAAGSRLGVAAADSVRSRRATAVIGACVAAPIIRRLFGRIGDGGAGFGMTVVLVVFDLLALAIVAVVASRGFGFGQAFVDQMKPALPDRASGPEPAE